MGKENFKQYLVKAWPWVVVVMVVAIVVQGLCLVWMHRRLAETQASGPEVVQLAPARPDDVWRDPLSNWGLDANGWDPFAEMQAMRERMNGMFGDAFGGLAGPSGFGSLFDPGTATPKIDLRDEGDRFILKVDLPDAANRSVNVSCENQQLTISGNVEQAKEDREHDGLFRSERRSRRFSQTIPLGAPVQAEKMKTEFGEDSVTVTIPKA